jgi:flavin reductase (DIM6/NTAB) family NADH-FMN oxidoreductase RutF
MEFIEVGADVGHRLLAPRIAYLVGTEGPGGPNLIPVSNVTSVSREPQLVVVAIYKKWQTNSNLKNGSGFTLSVPTADQTEIVWRLGAKYSGFVPPPGKSVLDACGGAIDYEASTMGPVLMESIGWLECRTVDEARIESDHGIFFGRVMRSFFNPTILNKDGLYIMNSRPSMQVVKNSFATTTDHWQIPYLGAVYR